jgi:DNA polymerase III, gamma/tau subunits
MLKEFEKSQNIACKIFKNAVKKEKISHAYLIETNNYEKKYEIALEIATYLLCGHYEREEKCQICNLEDVSNHPDIKIIKPEGQSIKKAQLEDLQKEFSTKSIVQGKKVYVVMDADKLNNSSANSILKFLEEPEENIYALIMVDNLYQVLPTIVSRCQIIKLQNNINSYFGNSTTEILRKILFIEEDKIEDLLENSLKLVKNMENNLTGCYLNINKIISLSGLKKEELAFYLDIVTLIYKDILNYLCDREVEIFKDYMNLIKELSSKTDIQKICDKINIITENKKNINYNVNLNMVIDCIFKSLKDVK